MLMRAERLVGLDDRKHGRDEIAGDGSIEIDFSHDFGSSGLEPEFFPGFAQRRRRCAFARIDTPAGEGDLSRVRAHMLSPDGQDHTWLLALGNGDQDGKGAQDGKGDQGGKGRA